MNIEHHNHRQIEMLNQRGGRTLSVVDLIQAGTINVEMAAYAMRAMHGGASLLTGAVPGGAGKTTLMAAMLHFLPAEVTIVTVDRLGVIADARRNPPDEPVCYLVHEIGSGRYFGYLWGPDVADFLSLAGGKGRIASCLHADTLSEVSHILCSPPLGVAPKSLGEVQIVMFMHVDVGSAGYRRRVAALHETDGRGGHRLLYRWNQASDRFVNEGEGHDTGGLSLYVAFIERLLREAEPAAEDVRRKVVEFYEDG